MGLRSSKDMDKRLRSATFMASNHMYMLRLLRENLIEDDNHAITKLGRCSRIALFNTHMLSEDKRMTTMARPKY